MALPAREGPVTRMPSVLMVEVLTPAKQVFSGAHLGGR